MQDRDHRLRRRRWGDAGEHRQAEMADRPVLKRARDDARVDGGQREFGDERDPATGSDDRLQRAEVGCPVAGFELEFDLRPRAQLVQVQTPRRARRGAADDALAGKV